MTRRIRFIVVKGEKNLHKFDNMCIEEVYLSLVHKKEKILFDKNFKASIKDKNTKGLVKTSIGDLVCSMSANGLTFFSGEESSPKKTHQTPQEQFESDISLLLVELGVPTTIKAHRYLFNAILLAASKPQNININDIYGIIAKENNVRKESIERSIERAMHLIMEKAKEDGNVLAEIYGVKVDEKRPPSSAEILQVLTIRARKYL